MVSHCGQSWPRWRLILGSLGRDGVSFWAVLGAMASHSGQSWAQWRRILGSLARNGVSIWAVLGAMAPILGSLGRNDVAFWAVLRDGVSFSAVSGAMASHSAQSLVRSRGILGNLGRDGVSF